MNLRARRRERRVELLKADPAVQMAGAIGRMFRIDPIIVLDDGGDEFIGLAREAAWHWVAEEEKKQNDEQERKSKAGRSGGAGRRPSRGRRR